MICMVENSKQTSKSLGLMYKGKQIIRKGDMLYFGDSKAKYIITMKILEKEIINDLNLARKVSIELQINDPSLKARKRIVKKAEREGLYSALDIGSIWLEDALASN